MFSAFPRFRSSWDTSAALGALKEPLDRRRRQLVVDRRDRVHRVFFSNKDHIQPNAETALSSYPIRLWPACLSSSASKRKMMCGCNVGGSNPKGIRERVCVVSHFRLRRLQRLMARIRLSIQARDNNDVGPYVPCSSSVS